MYEIFKQYKHDLKTATEKLKQFGVTKIIHLERVDVYLFYNGDKLINELKVYFRTCTSI